MLWGLYFGVLICLEKLLAPRFRAHPRKGLLAGLYRPVCLLLAVAVLVTISALANLLGTYMIRPIVNGVLEYRLRVVTFSV